MTNLVGYARVSTRDQHLASQLDALNAAGCVRVFVEHASGANLDRPEWSKVLQFLRPGDVLVVWRLDRLARSLRDLIEVVAHLEGREVELRSITEDLDTRTAGGRLVFHVFGALAEFERELIRERTHAGLAAARGRGRVGGRPTVMTREKIAAALTMRGQGMTQGQIAKVLGVSASALSRALTRAREAAAEAT